MILTFWGLGYKACFKSTAFCFICLAMENLPLLTAVINLKKTHSYFSVSCRKARCRPVSWGGEELWIDTLRTRPARLLGRSNRMVSVTSPVPLYKTALVPAPGADVSVLDLLFTWGVVCHISVCREDLDENLGSRLDYSLAEVNFESWLAVLARKSTWKGKQSIFSGWGISVKIY